MMSHLSLDLKLDLQLLQVAALWDVSSLHINK